MALEVDPDHLVEIVLGHPHQCRVTQDAGVVHEHVEVAESEIASTTKPWRPPTGDVVVAGDGTTPVARISDATSSAGVASPRCRRWRRRGR